MLAFFINNANLRGLNLIVDLKLLCDGKKTLKSNGKVALSLRPVKRKRTTLVIFGFYVTKITSASTYIKPSSAISLD